MGLPRRSMLTLYLAVLMFGFATTASAEIQLDSLKLPEGFAIELFAEGVTGARSLARSDGGVVYVGTMRAGKVYALPDVDGDHRADKVVTVASELFSPNGVAWRDGSLYVAEINRILRYDRLDGRLDSPPEPVVVKDDLPAERHHGWKFIRFGPDGKLYLQIGAPCNICDRGDPFAAISSMNPDGSDFEVFARGVRNTVGFDWHPESGELWFTDNGRDMLGDDVPPDELNRAPRSGLHFGYPYCHGADISDPEFGEGKDCSEFTPPALALDAHVAAIGMRFYTGEQFPPEYRHRIFIAEHGSWNRSEKSGYRVVTVTVDEQGRATDYRPFVDGWLQGRKQWGRPVDLLVMPDGSLLLSDDQAGVVYRISYSASAAASSAGHR